MNKNPTPDQLVAALGWEWEAFERDARNASTDVLEEARRILEPHTGNEVNDMKGDAAVVWIDKEIARRNGPIWAE